jgi:hypothetical protein
MLGDNTMQKVEIYIGYTDRTWDTVTIDMPIIIPEEEVENFIEQKAIKLWNNNPPVHRDIYFVGMYNVWPISDLVDVEETEK